MGYTTAALVNAEIRATSDFGTDTVPTLSTVNNWIEEESAWIDELTGSVFANTAVSSSYFDYDGADIFRLPVSDLISFDKLEYNVNAQGVTPSWIELEEGFDKNFLVYLEEGELEFINGAEASYLAKPKAGKKRFRISYTKGKNEVPYSVGKLATLLVVKRILSSLSNSQANSEGGTVQVGSIRITEPGSYSISYFKNLDSTIDELSKKLGQNYKVFRLTRVY